VFSLAAVAAFDRLSVQSFVPVIGCSSSSELVVEEGLSQVRHGVSVRPQQAQRSLLDVGSDAEAVKAWIGARAGAPATVKVYEREANRLLLWLKFERDGLALGGMTVSDCGDYMAFLYDVPAHWISRTHASPGQVGWAPFKGQLQLRSYQQSIGVVKGLFAWLHAAQYLVTNPWLLVNSKTGDDPAQRLLDSKAFSEQAAQEIQGFILRQASSPSRDRMLFIFRFMEAVGLRSAELLQARLGDFQLEPEGWFLQVHGKGSKNRLAVVPPVAMQALQAYLDSRGLPGIEHAAPNAPVLASTLDPAAGLGYQALYETVRSWLRRAVAASNLPARERQQLCGATTHWLRHTFGTRAIAREVPADVVQAQMGHASIQTTMSIYGRAPARRRAEILGQAFS
jgi:integrase